MTAVEKTRSTSWEGVSQAFSEFSMTPGVHIFIDARARLEKVTLEECVQRLGKILQHDAVQANKFAYLDRGSVLHGASGYRYTLLDVDMPQNDSFFQSRSLV